MSLARSSKTAPMLASRRLRASEAHASNFVCLATRRSDARARSAAWASTRSAASRRSASAWSRVTRSDCVPRPGTRFAIPRSLRVRSPSTRAATRSAGMGRPSVCRGRCTRTFMTTAGRARRISTVTNRRRCAPPLRWLPAAKPRTGVALTSATCPGVSRAPSLRRASRASRSLRLERRRRDLRTSGSAGCRRPERSITAEADEAGCQRGTPQPFAACEREHGGAPRRRADRRERPRRCRGRRRVRRRSSDPRRTSAALRGLALGSRSVLGVRSGESGAAQVA